MNSSKKFDNEKIYVLIVSLILIISVIIVIYMVLSSNSNLYKNTDLANQNQQNTTQNQNQNATNQNENSNNNLTQEEVDNMNVDENKVDEKASPTDTTNQAQAQNPTPKETKITAFTTTIYDKDANRVYNINLANKKLNGTVVKPGQEFSFNNTIGAMGQAQGFKKALGFDSDGNKIKTYGGGLCQISSTLYNCALNANLEVTERHPHSRRVYYVAKDRDATIYYGYLDFKFKNNTNNDIKIVSTNDNYNVTVELYKIEV